MASYSTGNQSIPANTATRLTLPTVFGDRYLYLQARTAVDMYFGNNNTVNASSTNANLIKSGKERVISIRVSADTGLTDEVWIFCTSIVVVDWALNSNIER